MLKLIMKFLEFMNYFLKIFIILGIWCELILMVYLILMRLLVGFFVKFFLLMVKGRGLKMKEGLLFMGLFVF